MTAQVAAIFECRRGAATGWFEALLPMGLLGGNLR